MKVRHIFAAFLFFLFFPLSAFAAEPNQTVVLPKNETVNHNYFATGSNVDIEGTVNGDVYAAGGSVLINGTVNGDVLAAGGQVTIRGTVQNVRVAGGQIVIDGKINGNVTSVGGNITTTSSSTIAGSLVGAGGQFSLSGPITKTVSLATGQATIGNSIGSDVWISGQTITFTPQAKVQGNVSYVSSQKATIGNGAVISGKLSQTIPTPQPSQQRERERAPGSVFAALAGLRIGLAVASFLISLIVGLLLISLTPIYTGRVMEHLSKHPWHSFLVGFVTWILTPFIVIILLITLVGIPFAILLGILVAVFSYIGKIIASVVIGMWVVARFDKRKNIAVALLIGLLVVEIVGLIPFLGWVFTAVVSAVGFGAVLYMEKVYYTELRAKKII